MIRYCPILLIALFFLLVTRFSYAQQAPQIKYTNPSPYTAGTGITPLSPANSGGVVPPNIYSQVSTFVGTVGVFGSMDGNGTNATISSPFGLAVAPDGSTLYFSDYNNSVVRKVTSSGDVTTFAGTAHTRGYVDANGTNAQFSDPSGIVLNKTGTIYITDYYNNMVRKITAGGAVSSLAGLAGQRGITDGMGTNARFYQPAGIAVSATGDLYISDTENNEIRKVAPDGTVTTFAGNPVPGSNNGNGIAASFYKPQGLVFDAAGNLYVADANNNLIRKITASGDVTTFAGSGVAGSTNATGTAASFNGPLGITIDQAGNFYVADKTNNLIRKITAAGVVTTFAGNGMGDSKDGIGLNSSFGYPGSVAIDNNGLLYVGDLSNFVIRKVSLTGYTIDKPLPKGLIFDKKTGLISGTPLFTSPLTTYTITAYNVYGSNSTTVNIQVDAKVVTIPSPPAISYQTPQTFTAYSPISPLIPKNTGGAIPANVYGQVSTVAGNAAKGNTNGSGVSASFNGPADVTFDPSGKLFVTETVNSDVRRIDPAGNVTTFAASIPQTNGAPVPAFNGPYGITSDPGGNIYVADKDNQVVKEINSAGVVSTYAGDGNEATFDGPALQASFTDPFDGVFDGAGDLFVVDRGNSRIREINANGYVSTLYALDTNNDPDTNADTDIGFITIDQHDNLFITYQNHIIKVTPAGVVSTFAGSDLPGFADGSGATARFDKPYGLTIDVAGNLYVGDAGNNAVRKITPQGVVTTVAGDGSPGTADGLRTLARFSNPYGLTLNNTGDFIYLADNGNNLIRKIAVTGYAIDKPLPAGLSFDATTGIISGTPTVPSPATVYTVTAYNAGGSSVANLTITVGNGTLLPPNISYVTPQVYTTGTSIPALIPSNSGGAVPATVYGQVSTYATGTQNGINVDNNFNSVVGIANDIAGNIIIGDYVSNTIKRLSNGVVTLVAGGSPGYVDATGSAARFLDPNGVTLNANGDIYVAEQGNNMIRRVTQGGVVTTVAGMPQVSGNNNGQGTNATFSNPTNLIFDAAGNLFVSDLSNNSIRKITSSGFVSTFAGSAAGVAGNKDGTGTAAEFKSPYGLAFDGNGNLFVTDLGNNVIRKITPGAMVTTFAGNGLAGKTDGAGTAASFNAPEGIYIDRTGNLFIADGANYEVRKITPNAVVSTVAGSGSLGRADGVGALATFSFLSGIVGDNIGNLYVADRDNILIRKIVVTGYSIDKQLPPGLIFDATTGTISGTPTAASPPTNYIITAYNVAGSSATIVNITVKENPALTFKPFPGKTVCDADFDPGATGNVTITYTSNNPIVATVTNNMVHITGAGSAVITASGGGQAASQILTVNPAVTPSITIALQSGTGCPETLTTFIATPVNGGAAPIYQWKVNGISEGQNSVTFQSSTLSNKDQITCTLTNNSSCTTLATAVSDPVIFTAIVPLSSSVTITSSAKCPVCAGTEVTFEAKTINGGANPAYQWQVNGNNAGENSPVFASSSLNNSDIVTCMLNSSAQCTVVNPVISNPVVTTLSPASNCIINIPNTFTPNGDGINDQWNITALIAYKNCTVSIFTRYGNMIYNSIGYPRSWDGTYKGSAVPVGTYYYVINLKNGSKPLSGFIAVLR